MKRILLIALVAVLAASVFAGCAPAASGEDAPAANEEYVKLGKKPPKTVMNP